MTGANAISLRSTMYTLAHLSDPHLGPLPPPRLRELASKRVLGYVNWQRNRAGVLLEEPLTRLVDDLLARHPDHIAVTGDLINLALNAELLPARRWLATLGSAEDVSVVPGNHDAYVPGALSRAWQAWADHMSDDDKPPSTAGERFPYVRRRGPIAIVGTSSAVATGPFMATGTFGSLQAQRLRDALRALARQGLFRVVLIHHPPVRGSTSWYKRLAGSARFRAAIAEAGAELVLHGHTHRRSLQWIGEVPVVGVPAASNAGHAHGAAYNLFQIAGEPGSWDCELIERGFSATSAGIVETGRHMLYRSGRPILSTTVPATATAGAPSS